MNIQDFKDQELPTGDKLKLIFDRQKELMGKYHDIEVKSGIGHGVLNGEPFDLDSQRSQYLLKDFAWRATEEIGEALEALSEEHLEHAQEEVADALHFLVELALVAGVDDKFITSLMISLNPEGLPEGVDGLDLLFLANKPNEQSNDPLSNSIMIFVMSLGVAMNCLKQKPWKQTHFVTDAPKFMMQLWAVFGAWAMVAQCVNMDANLAFDRYFKKSSVNEFRQKSNY